MMRPQEHIVGLIIALGALAFVAFHVVSMHSVKAEPAVEQGSE